jgi:protein-S-isoprenylcysteine O-methyltransferase Ste14
MHLAEEFTSSGAWLFRWRSYFPILFVAVIVPAMVTFTYLGNSHALDMFWEILCLAVSFCGLAIRIITVGFVPGGTSGRGTLGMQAHTLNTTGMYSLVRHPLYLGNFFIGLGVVLFVHLWWVLIVYTLAFWIYYERIMLAEEAFLLKTFGNDFLDWAARTNAFFPVFKHWKKPELGFSVRSALKREYHGFFGIIAAFTFLETAGDWIVNKKPVFDPLWVVLFAAASSIYIAVRILARKTRILEVEGR